MLDRKSIPFVLISCVVFCKIQFSVSLECFGQNEEFIKCRKICERTCDNFMNSRTCSIECVDGCFCMPGFVRNQFYQCVEIDECHIEGYKFYEVEVGRCPSPFTQFKTCGPVCQDTCANPNASKSCHNGCFKGCFCEDGYVRDSLGDCIPIEMCPNADDQLQCPDSKEEFDHHGPACPLTCENYGISFECPEEESVAGCFCKKGLIRNKFGKCILPALCDIVDIEFPEIPFDESTFCSGDNEEYRKAGRLEPTCKSIQKEMRPYTSKSVFGCFCKPGYVRDENRNCILRENCPKDVCSGNHETFACGSPCDVTCKNLDSGCNRFSRVCVEKCYCAEGFARDHRNKCVPIMRCPQFCKYLTPFFHPFDWHYDFITYKKIDDLPEESEDTRPKKKKFYLL